MLSLLMLLYGAASLLHFAHNAVFIDDYPGLPAWLSSARVWAAWFGVTSLGVAGYLLMRLDHRYTGLVVTAVYAGLGFDGLAHYSVAPFAAHTWTMNLTILLEVAAAAALVVVLVARFVSYLPRRRMEA
jgi:hypothetical protein